MPQVRDVMTSKVLVTTPDKTVVEAAKLMKDEGRGSIVIVDNEKPVAIVTERDFLKKVVAKGLTPKEVLVRDVMSSPLITASPEMSIKDAAQLMTSKEIRRLPVIENNKLVGIITTADFFPRIDMEELV